MILGLLTRSLFHDYFAAMPLKIFLLILASVSLNSLAQICLRKGMLAIGGLNVAQPVATAVAAAFNPYVVFALTCYVVSIVGWMGVLSKTEVSVAYPFLSIGYILAAFMGWYFLSETITVMRIAGIALICAGLYCISRTA